MKAKSEDKAISDLKFQTKTKSGRMVRMRGETLGRAADRSRAMKDVLFVLATVAFFALAIAYVRACERLK